MEEDQQTASEPAQLPVAPGHIRDAALAELERLSSFVEGIPPADWSRPSAATGWSIGDVVAHLDIILGIYARLVPLVAAGHGGGSVWKALDSLSKTVVPASSPAINAINQALPRLIDRTLSPATIKRQFGSAAGNLREKLERVGPHDYTRPVYYMGAPWPLSFFLAAVVNELAMHGWDMESVLNPQAHLSAEARSVVPWFYWGGTSFLLHMPAQVSGTIAVSLADPAAEMWWRIGGEAAQGAGPLENADVTISGESGTFCLALGGRIPPDAALRSTSLTATGDGTMARLFLGCWKIV